MREKSHLKDQDQRIQNRILSLEMELRQMGREGLLTGGQYQQRSLNLKKLQIQFNDLKRLRYQGIAESQKRDSSWFEIPLFSQRLPQETSISLKYLEEFHSLLSHMLKECNYTGRLVRRSIRGRLFEILTTFDLAKIRRSLVRLDVRIRNFSQRKKQWTTYTGMVREHLKNPDSLQGFPDGLRPFRKKYFETGQLNEEVSSLRLRCEQMKDELDLMENWLSFQEWRLTQTWVPEGKRLSLPPACERNGGEDGSPRMGSQGQKTQGRSDFHWPAV